MAAASLRSHLASRRCLLRISTARDPSPRLTTPSSLPLLASLSRSVMDLVGEVRSGTWSWAGREETWDTDGDVLTAIVALQHDPKAIPERVAATLETADDLEDLRWVLLELAESFGVPTPTIAVLPPGSDDFDPDDEEGEAVPASEIIGRIVINEEAFAVRKGFSAVEAIDILWEKISGPGSAWAVRSPKPPKIKTPVKKKPVVQATPPSPARLAVIAEAAGRGRLQAARTSKACFATLSRPRPTDGAVHLVAVCKADRSVARRAVVYPSAVASKEEIAEEVESAFRELFAKVEAALAATSV